MLAGIGGILTLSTLFFLPETLTKDKRVQGGVLSSLANTGRLFRERAYLCYTCVQGFTMGGFFAYVSASPFVFQNVYGLSMERFSLIFAVNAIGMVCTSLLAGWLSKRFGDKRLLLAGDMARTLACGAVFYVCLVTPASPWPLMIALFAMLAMQSFTLSPSFSLAICSQSVGAGAASGILGVAVFLFGALTSPLTGLAGPQSALPLGIIVLVTGLCSLCSSILGNRLYETKLVP